MPSLDDSLLQLASTPVLLVATDFDGTLAPIVPDPDDAEPGPRSRRALSTLARQYHTRVAVISGRGLQNLEERLQPSEDDILLVGSHGSEFEPELSGRLTDRQRALHRAIHAAVERAAEGLDGILTEHKDASSSLHYRKAQRETAAQALFRLRRELHDLDDPGPQVKRGKKVIELSVVPTHKGDAIARIKSEVGATAVLYIGDDRTDEDAFQVLGADDVSVKVGSGPTLAQFRVEGPDEVADLLARLADFRSRALRSSVSIPITDLGFVSDQRTGALVTPSGEICWYCPSRFDSPSIFASILGGPTAGRFVVAPAGQNGLGHQRYLDNSLVLETRWPELRVVDYIDHDPDGDGRSVLVREVHPVRSGAVCAIEFAPHPDYARMHTRLAQENDALSIIGGRESPVLEAPGVAFRIERRGGADLARAEVSLDAPLRLVLRAGRRRSAYRSAERVTSDWAAGLAGLQLPERWSDVVARSVLTLRGLLHAPAGSMVAALTTSLPEAIGYERNWDYRYCWLRDTAFACDALLRVGSLDEAHGFLQWMTAIVAQGDPMSLQPLYGVEGESRLPEGDLPNLIGYGGSQPVRIGNAAAEQLQIDVYGAIVDLVYNYHACGGEVSPPLQYLVKALVDATGGRWDEPDAGIWEHRHLYRHHVHSKVMCWVAVDRAIALFQGLGRDLDPNWLELRQRIAEDVLDKGWSESAGAYTVAYDSDDMDAAVLFVLLSGLLKPDDPRAVATVRAVQSTLVRGSSVYRYLYRDGFTGEEGAFHICTAWLVDALSMIGEKKEATRLFTHMIGSAGATGLLSEQVDPATGRALGNVPQAYSHTGVIWNALTLSDSPRSRTRFTYPA